MKPTQLKENIDANCRKVLREAAEMVGKPIAPPTDDYTEVIDPAAYYTDYNNASITFQETLAAGNTLKKLLSYMSIRSKVGSSLEAKREILELIVEASKIYSHINLNEETKKDNTHE